VRTLVISDLHLGARTQTDVLRYPAALDALLQRLDGIEQLVLLGDTLELRHGPLDEALAIAEPVLRAIGARLADAEVVLVAGNHDHGLVADWLEARAARGPLGLEERAGPDATARTRRLAELLAPATLSIAYPGLWVADGVYATHGHYLDRHLTVPSLERLGVGAIARGLRARPERMAAPDDYEVVLAPLYAFVEALAARSVDGRGVAPGSVSTRAWQALQSDAPTSWRRRASRGALPLAVGAANALGLGPLRPDLSGVALRRSGLAAMRDVVTTLQIPAQYVVFGHTHRGGPRSDDDVREWDLAAGGSLVNSGSWVLESFAFGPGRGGPYWPGAAVELDADGVPRPVRLLDDVPAERLTPRP
jgi:Calcineurin-like phosphoesterase